MADIFGGNRIQQMFAVAALGATSYQSDKQQNQGLANIGSTFK